jgi:hypothetical protein
MGEKGDINPPSVSPSFTKGGRSKIKDKRGV